MARQEATGEAPAAAGEDAFWSVPLEELLASLGTDGGGLGSAEAARRLSRQGPNSLAPPARGGALRLLVRQFTSPIILILSGAALLSFVLDSPTDGLIILVIVLISGLLGFWQENGAAGAVAELLRTVQTTARVRRDGSEQAIPVAEVVPGDVLVLSAGAGIPADCRVLEERDLSLNEAALTGESFPVSKHPVAVAADAPLARRTNVLYVGTHVVSGVGTAFVVRTGAATQFAAIAKRLRQRSPETDFERGVRRFGALLLEVTLVLVVAIFAVNVFLQRPVVDSFLFALALGVGLTPQLLPAIISVNLAQGARRMAAQRVIVKRLSSIENFGSMAMLCSDKTGTLTEGSARVQRSVGIDGTPHPRVLRLEAINAGFETGFGNPIDAAIREAGGVDLSTWTKLDEIPFDFSRKRLSVLARCDGAPLLITKGAFLKVLEVCDRAEAVDGSVGPLAAVEPQLRRLYADWSEEGYRVLAVALRRWPADGPVVPRSVSRQDESGMVFLGLLALSDPLRPGVRATVAELDRLGVRLKMITGDNALVAARVGREAGLRDPRVLTGSELEQLSDSALPVRAEQVDVFAEIEPNQKERLILRPAASAGHVVGYLGDGINDAPALHAADVGLSVQERGGRGPGGGRHRAARARSGGAAGGHPGGPPHLRQHAQVRVHGHQRQLRQHVQHGRRLPAAALPAAAAQADPAHQPAHRSAGDDHLHRPGRSRLDRSPPPLEHPLHPALHDRLRAGELHLRLPHLRGAAAGAPCRRRPVPQRLVRGVGDLRRLDRAGDPHPRAPVPQPALPLAGRGHHRRGGPHPAAALDAPGAPVRIRAPAADVPADAGIDPAGLRGQCRAGQGLVLPPTGARMRPRLPCRNGDLRGGPSGRGTARRHPGVGRRSKPGGAALWDRAAVPQTARSTSLGTPGAPPMSPAAIALPRDGRGPGRRNAPTLQTIGREFRSLAADMLLPPGRGRLPSAPALLRGALLLMATAALALGAAVVLTGASCQLLAQLLGPARLDLDFPYLGAALASYSARGQGAIALAGGGAALVVWLLLLSRLAADLRRRWLALTLLLALLVVATAVDVAFTEGNGAVMEALNQRSAPGFWGTAAGLSAIYLATLPLQFLNTYGQQRFALAWRDRTTTALSSAYLAGRAYYRIETAGVIDNPDQRIADDVERAVGSATGLFFGFCASLLSLAAYVLVLFGISGTLVLTLLISTLAGNLVILRLVRRLASLSFRQQGLEADFRYALMHLRSHAERVAFLRGEPRLRRLLGRRFGRVLVNLERVIRWRAFVGQGTGLYGFLMQFVPYLVLSGAYFGGRVSLGQLTVGSIAFGQVQAALSFLVDRADDFSGLFASLHRIGELRGVTDASPDGPPAPGAEVSKTPPAAAALLRLEGLSVGSPDDGRLLVRRLDLSLAPGERLLISGPSGCGKTTLLRVLCGLVPAVEGRLLLPPPSTTMVLPQKPFLALGSLRDQLLATWPEHSSGRPASPPPFPPDDDRLRRVLRAAQLNTLIDRYPDLDVEADWDQVLSGGEQQRLGFARLLLGVPPLVLLDEATSALDLASEDHLYRLLLEAGTTLISVGHRPSLVAFHSRVLRLDGRGGGRSTEAPYPPLSPSSSKPAERKRSCSRL